MISPTKEDMELILCDQQINESFPSTKRQACLIWWRALEATIL